jgi:mono/diheme cytochrome c family protein
MKNYIFLLGFVALACISCNDNKDQKTPETNYNTAAAPEKKQTPLQVSVKRGKEIYRELCVTCHLTSGKGVAGNFPPLNPSDWLTKKRTESIHAVKYGLKGEIVVNGATYNNVMLSLGLEDDEVADVMNYIIQTWNEGEMVTLEEVQAVTK